MVMCCTPIRFFNSRLPLIPIAILLASSDTLNFSYAGIYFSFQQLQGPQITKTYSPRTKSIILKIIKILLDDPNIWLSAIIVFMILFVILIVVVIVMRGRIILAIALLQEATK